MENKQSLSGQTTGRTIAKQLMDESFGASALIWASKFFKRPLGSLSAVPLRHRDDGGLMPAVRFVTQRALADGQFKLSRSRGKFRYASAGWSLYLGDLPVVAIDLDEKNGKQGWSRFQYLLSGLGCASALEHVLAIQSPSGGRHLYFEASDYKAFLAEQGVRSRSFNLGDGMELFWNGAINWFGAQRKDGRFYRKLYSPESVDALPTLPAPLLYFVSGGFLGDASADQIEFVKLEFPDLYAWFVKFRTLLEGGYARRTPRGSIERVSRFYLFAYQHNLLREEWLEQFLTELSVQVSGNPCKSGYSSASFYFSCPFHADLQASATLTLQEQDDRYAEAVQTAARRYGMDAASFACGGVYHRVLTRCFVCCRHEDEREPLLRYFGSLMFLYGSWLYDRGHLTEAQAAEYAALLHHKMSRLVGPKWLMTPLFASVSTSLLDTPYQPIARKLTSGRYTTIYPYEGEGASSRFAARRVPSAGGATNEPPLEKDEKEKQCRRVARNGDRIALKRTLMRFLGQYAFGSAHDGSWDRRFFAFFMGVGSRLGFPEYRGCFGEAGWRQLARWYEDLNSYHKLYHLTKLMHRHNLTDEEIQREWRNVVQRAVKLGIIEPMDQVQTNQAGEPMREPSSVSKETLERAILERAKAIGYGVIRFGSGVAGGSEDWWRRNARFLAERDPRVAHRLIEILDQMLERGLTSAVVKTHSSASVSGTESPTVPVQPSPSLTSPRTESASEVPCLAVSYDRIQLPPKMQDDDAAYLVGEWIRRGQIVILSGRPGAYKSTLMRNLASALAAGGTFFGAACKPSTILYLPFDETLYHYLDQFDPMLKRLVHRGALERVHTLTLSTELEQLVESRYQGDWMHALFEQARFVGADVLMVDTMASLQRLWNQKRRRVSEQDAAYWFMQDLRRYAEQYGVAVVMTAHSGKMFERLGDDPNRSADTSYAVLGHTAFAAGADAVWYSEALDAQQGTGRLMTSKCRHKPFDYRYYVDGSGIMVYRFHASRKRENGGTDLAMYDWTVDYERVRRHRKSKDVALPAGFLDTLRTDLLSSEVADPSPNAPMIVCFHDQPSQQMAHEFTSLNDAARDAVLLYDPQRIRHGSRYLFSLSDESDRDTVLMLHGALPETGDATVYRQLRRLPKGYQPSEGDWLVDGYLLRHALDGYRPFGESETVQAVRRVVFDFECSHLKPSEGEILAIGVYNDRGESFVIRGETELDTIRQFDEYLLEYAPEWLVGYNIFGFDLPYLEARCKKHGYTFRFLEERFRKRHVKFRYGSSFEETDIYYTRGSLDLDPYARCAIVDLYLLALRHLTDLERYRLPDVVAHYFGEQAAYRAVDDKSRMVDWSDAAVRQQVLEDVRMTDLILPKLVEVEFRLTHEIPMPLSQLLYSGQGARWQSMMTAAYLKRGAPILEYPMPKEDYQGAIADHYATGVFSPVAKVDVASLYPSIIVKHQIAPSADYLKLLPTMVQDLMQRRLTLKKLAKETGDPTYAAQQNALKVLINSAYGFLGAAGVRFSDMQAAAQVTSTGRELLIRMRDRLNQDFFVLEVDTDGVMVHVSNDRVSLESVVDELQRETGYTIEIDWYEAAVVIGAKNYALLGRDGSVKVFGSGLKNRSASRKINQLASEMVLRLLQVRSDSDYDALIDWLDESVQSFKTTPADQLIERLRVSDKTTDRSDLVFLDEELPKLGEQMYVYYPRGGSRRVVCRELPETVELDLSRYLEKFYNAIARFKPIEPFWSRFQKRYGSMKRFKQILDGQADLGL